MPIPYPKLPNSPKRNLPDYLKVRKRFKAGPEGASAEDLALETTGYLTDEENVSDQLSENYRKAVRANKDTDRKIKKNHPISPTNNKRKVILGD